MNRWAGVVLVVALGSGPGFTEEPPLGVNARIAALARLPLNPATTDFAAQLRAGLLDPDPAVRAAAARITHTSGHASLLPSVREALGVETDPDAAREEAWALADLDGTDASDAALVAALSRPALSSGVAEAFFAGRGVRALPLWSSLQSAVAADAGVVGRGLESGLQRDAISLFASVALRDQREDLFDSLSSRPGIASSLLVAALASPSSHIRTTGYLQMAATGSTTSSESLRERKKAESVAERVAAHLFEAAQGLPRTESMDQIAGALSGADDATRRAIRSRLAQFRNASRGLSRDDHERLLRAAGVEKEDLARALNTPVPPATVGELPQSPPQAPVIKTFGVFPPRFVASVLEATKCQGAPSNFNAVEVSYRPGGRPARVTPYASSGSLAGCPEAALLLAVASHPADGDQASIHILPLHPDYLKCVAQKESQVTRPAPGTTRVGGNIKEPTKIRNLAPVYPPGAVQERQEGVVIIDAVIRDSGCVGRMRVLRSVSPLLDLSALTAVSAWKYTPTLLDGVPVPVVMTVTVNFRLR